MQSQVDKFEERPPEGEDAATSELVKLSVSLQPDDPPVRQQHPKSHGCVMGEFIVEKDVPENMKFGVFKESRTYPVWIRFSNGSGNQPDTVPDIRGMAIKLMDVDGEKVLEEEKHERTQDFILMNHPVFFLQNVQSTVDFAKAVKAAEGKPKFLALLAFLTKFAYKPFRPHVKEFNTLKSARKVISSPLETQYWSATPYKLGPNAIKFSATPHSNGAMARADSGSQNASENYLRDAMIKHLDSNEACFDFKVQLQKYPENMPVEDPTIEWSEKESPFLKVAVIRIPSQKFNMEERKEFDENLSFNPWHSLPDHRPLGGVNRARKEVYQTLSKLRHQTSKEPIKEPTP